MTGRNDAADGPTRGDPEDDAGRTHRPRWPLLLATAIVSAIGLAWVVPQFAVALIWPLLFAVPGWVIVGRAVPSLSAPGRVGVGVVTSIYFSAHLVNLASIARGSFDRESIFAVATVLALLSGVFALSAAPVHRPRLHVLRSVRAASLAPWVIAASATLAVGVVLGTSIWHHTDAGWVSGGWNWSDLLVHVSIANSLIAGNFPPQVPYFSGVPLAYHWFADFHAAIAASVAQMDVIPVFVATNALMAGVLALVVWELARSTTGDRRVASIAAALTVFGGGLGWIRLPMDLFNGGHDLGTLLATTSYDNVWTSDVPVFRIASVFGTGLLAHRATALGLPGLVAVVVLACHSMGRYRWGMLLAGVLAALLAPFQFYLFPAVYLIVALLFLVRRPARLSTWLTDGALFAAPVVLALPFVVGPLILQHDAGAIQFVAGWSEAPWTAGPLAVAFFYITNLGLPFALALVALLWRSTPRRAFYGLWLVALFAVPNLLVVSAVAFDMNKYFQVMWVAAAVLAGTVIARWRRPIVAAVVLVAAISPILVGVWHVESGAVAMTDAQEQAAVWIRDHTPPGSVFVTDTYINSPVDLAGRLRITSFGPYVSNLGYDPSQRAHDVDVVRCDGAAAAAQVMVRYGAAYVLSSGGRLDCPGVPTDLSATPLFETVYDEAGVSIWQYRGGS